jgi:hypothetical protein
MTFSLLAKNDVKNLAEATEEQPQIGSGSQTAGT